MLPALEPVPRSIRLQTDAANIGVQLLQSPRRTDKRTAGPKRRNKMRDPPVGLLPDFVCGSAIVRLPVRRIAVLVRIEIFLRLRSGQLADAAKRGGGTLIPRRHHQVP